MQAAGACSTPNHRRDVTISLRIASRVYLYGVWHGCATGSLKLLLPLGSLLRDKTGPRSHYFLFILRLRAAAALPPAFLRLLLSVLDPEASLSLAPEASDGEALPVL